MTYPSDYYHSAYAGYAAPGAGYGDYPWNSQQRPPHRDRWLRVAAAVAGLAVFGVSLAAPTPLGLVVALSAAAAILAAIGLLPAQDGRDWLVVTLAGVGLIDAVTGWVFTEPGWAGVVVTVLTALQTLAAVACLLMHAGALGSADHDDRPGYDAYAAYAHAYEAYTRGQQESALVTESGQASAHGHGTAGAYGRAAAGARADADQESYAALQDRYAPYGGATGQTSRGPVSAPHAPQADPGIPGAGRGQTPTAAPRVERGDRGETWPG